MILLFVGLITAFVPAAGQADVSFPCADGMTTCGGSEFDPYITDTATGPKVIGGGSLICRATYGDRATYCFIEAFQKQPDNTMKQICAQGTTSAGWCSCERAKDGRIILKGSCLFE
ncbi:MAG TPA: hypothetical protein VF618_23000 [Thermoanaerobaculia bacterium]